MPIRPREPTGRPLPQYLHLVPGDTPPEMDPAAPYRAVVVAQAEVELPWRLLVCGWLVRSGCLYAMAWGRDREQWHDGVDECHLTMFGSGDIPDERHVVTTWHDDEPLGGVFWFCVNCATHPHVELARTIILHIAPAPKEAELLAAYRAAADAWAPAPGAPATGEARHPSGREPRPPRHRSAEHDRAGGGATDGRSSAMHGRSSAAHGPSSAAHGRSSVTDGRSGTGHGRSSPIHGRSSAVSGRSSVTPGRSLAAHGRSSATDGPSSAVPVGRSRTSWGPPAGPEPA